MRRREQVSMNKSVMTLFICTFLAVGGVLYWAFSDNTQIHVQKEEDEAQKILTYEGNTLSEEKDGKKIWDLTAETITIDPQTKNVTLKNIQGVFYQDDGNNINLTAPTAVYDNKTHDIIITEKVIATRNDGSNFTADQVLWQNSIQKFSGEGNIKIVQADTVITGDKMETDSGMNKVKVEGNAHVIKGGAE